MTTKSKTTSQTQVKTTVTTLTPLEEQVVRMRHGFTAPDSLKLEQRGQDNPELAAKLQALEERALAAVGARNNPTKRKIVSSLRRK